VGYPLFVAGFLHFPIVRRYTAGSFLFSLFMLEAVSLECLRGDRRLFSGLDFSVSSGELLYLQGRNGAGKTSLLRMVIGLLPPSVGEIRWRGAPIRQQAEAYRAELCYLGHHHAIKEEFTPLENLTAALALYDQALPEAEALAALAQVGLAGREDLPCKHLSQGQKRRVALARLVLDRRALWVLDEPFVALDVAAVSWLASVIGAQVARGGMVIMTTHQAVDVPGAQVRTLRLS
jgi:heme exporter protein A